MYFIKKDEYLPFFVYFWTVTGSSGCLSQLFIGTSAEVPVIVFHFIFLIFISKIENIRPVQAPETYNSEGKTFLSYPNMLKYWDT